MKKIISIIALLLCLLPFTANTAKAAKDLDRILEYYITVDPRDDGTLDMEYVLIWKVLDSTSEGPLEWVKIGVPNKQVDEMVALSDQIKKISFTNENGDTCIRLDLNRKYYEGEIVYLHFSFHQSYMFTLIEEDICYEFIPGWFNDSIVDYLSVKWKEDGTIYSNTTRVEDGYLLWSIKNFDYNHLIKVQTRYLREHFPNIDLEKTYENAGAASTTEKVIVFSIAGFFVAVFIIITIVAISFNRQNNDGYYNNRGFERRYHKNRFFHKRVNRSGESISSPHIANGSGSGGGSSCACACACACAGGGRAGCSRKDFYNPNLKIDEFIEGLE